MTTVSTALTRTAYTAIATGPRRVVVDYASSGQIRLVLAASLPVPGATQFFRVAPDAGGRIVTVPSGSLLYGMTEPTFGADIAVGVSPHEEIIIGSVEVTNDTGSPLPVSATALTNLDADVGSPADAAWSGTGDGTVIALLKAAALAETAATPAGENFIGATGRRVVAVEATFVRPADTTAYASGDLVANSTTAGSVAALSLALARVTAGGFSITRLRLRKSSTGVANASFRVHFYTAAPTATNGDNGVWLTNGAANYRGSIDVTMDRAFSDGAAGMAAPSPDFDIRLASGTAIFALIEARAAYAPANGETFGLMVEAVQD
jgi:hypothetical protein